MQKNLRSIRHVLSPCDNANTCGYNVHTSVVGLVSPFPVTFHNYLKFLFQNTRAFSLDSEKKTKTKLPES